MLVILSDAKDLGTAGKVSFASPTHLSFWGQMLHFVQHDQYGGPARHKT